MRQDAAATWRTHRGEVITTAELYRRCAIMLEHGRLPRAVLYDRVRTAAAIILYGHPARESAAILAREDIRPAGAPRGPLAFYDSVYGPEPYRRDRAARILRHAAVLLHKEQQAAAEG